MARRDTSIRNVPWTGLTAAACLLALLVLAAGCSPPPPPASQWVADTEPDWEEEPASDGDWRPHLLSRCREADVASAAAERALDACYALYSSREGGDAIMELELFLQDHSGEGLLLLTLAQLYVLAGQGEPECLPTEGPAADVGDWPRNKERLLGRAQTLLERAAELRPDDGAVDFLQADVARARGDQAAARAAESRGSAKCTLPRSFDTLRRYQELGLRAARLLESVTPTYPEQALRAGLSGEVVLDLLIDPSGAVVQTVVVASPGPSLTAAADRALRGGRYEAARVGKYPIWSWLRIPVRFGLSGGGER